MYPAQVFTFFALKTVLWTLSDTERQNKYSTTESTKCTLYIAISSFSKKKVM